MKTSIRNVIWTAAAVGILVVGSSDQAAAEEGIVSISDGGPPASAEFLDAVAKAYAAYPSGGGYPQGPGVVKEGAGYEVTGNWLKDLVSDAKMRHNMRKTKRLMQEKARQFCPGCGRRVLSEEDTGPLFKRMMRKAYESDVSCKRKLLGYFAADGCCGQGCPLWGHYHLLYPTDPSYLDPRDTRVYAAAGYGVPVSVPLPPTVRYMHNYGWGIPASRVTPVSTLLPW